MRELMDPSSSDPRNTGPRKPDFRERLSHFIDAPSQHLLEEWMKELRDFRTDIDRRKRLQKGGLLITDDRFPDPEVDYPFLQVGESFIVTQYEQGEFSGHPTQIITAEVTNFSAMCSVLLEPEEKPKRLRKYYDILLIDTVSHSPYLHVRMNKVYLPLIDPDLFAPIECFNMDTGELLTRKFAGQLREFIRKQYPYPLENADDR